MIGVSFSGRVHKGCPTVYRGLREVSNLFNLGDECYAKYLADKFAKGLGIRVMRRLVGVTQQDLATALDITPFEVSAWENGLVPCPPECIRQISQALGVLPARLLNPAAVDVDAPSYVALHDGHEVQRMALLSDYLKVEHDTVPYDLSTDPDLFRESPNGILAREKLSERRTDHKPTVSELSQQVKWVYGPSSILYNLPNDRFPWFLRKPTGPEVVRLSFGGWIYLGDAIRAYLRLKHRSNRWLADKLNCDPQHSGNMLLDPGYTTHRDSSWWAFLIEMEHVLELEPGTLQMYTQHGREVALSAVMTDEEKA